MRVKDIAEQAEASEEIVETEADDLFEMANLYPGTTGLPTTVWVSPRGNARHDVRVKVNMTYGNQTNIANTAVVGARPMPRVISGRLSPADVQAVYQWVSLNEDVGCVLGRAHRYREADPGAETAAAPTRCATYALNCQHRLLQRVRCLSCR